MLKFKPHMVKFFDSITEKDNAENLLGKLFMHFPNSEVKLITGGHVVFVSIGDMTESLESQPNTAANESDKDSLGVLTSLSKR